MPNTKQDYQALWGIARALHRTTPVGQAERTDHGPDHWKRVLLRGEALAAATEGADIDVVRTFAIVHDCCRINEFADPGHGPRAANMIRRLWQCGGLPIDLNGAQMETLYIAIKYHDVGDTSNECPTTGCCWDADRLDLGRVGKQPDPTYFSTTLGKTMAALFV